LRAVSARRSNLDWHHVREHRRRPGERAAEWERWSMDERWVLPTAEELLERSVAVWNERFELVIEDLVSLPRSRPIVAEGPSAFPWNVTRIISSPRQAIFLVPAPPVRDRIREGREVDGPRFGDDTGDPARARANLRARDLLLNQRIAASCEKLGLRWIWIDGSLDLDASLALLEEHFRPHLPDTLNV
jgi:hypothetical protein